MRVSTHDSEIVRWMTGVVSRSDTLTAWRVRAGQWWRRVWDEPASRKRTLRTFVIVGAVLIVGGGVASYFAFRPVPKPDYRHDSIRRIFNYTLLTDEFNRLPVDERVRLLAIVRERLEAMSSGESALLAAFAAGIAGKSRDQLEENVSRLLVDVWDMHALEYPNVTAEQRDAYLDGVFIEIARLMETVSGDSRELSDSELLSEGREQAQRDVERMRSGEGPGARTIARMNDVLVNGVGGHASPQQRARGQVMFRDMVKRLRGGETGGGG